MEKVTTWTD